MLISMARLGLIPLYPSAPPPPPTAVFDTLWMVNVVPSAPPLLAFTSEYLNEAVKAPFPVPKLARLNGVANHAAFAWLPVFGVTVITLLVIAGAVTPTRLHPVPLPPNPLRVGPGVPPMPRVVPALKFTVPPVVVVVGIVGARVKLVVPPLIVAVAAAVTFGRLAVPPLVVTLLTAAYGPRLAVPPLVVTFGVVPSAVMLVTFV